MPKIIPELKVKDFEKSLSFYVDTAGFSILYDRPEEKFAMLNRDGAMLMIEQLGNGDRWVIGKMEYPLGQGINFQIQIDEVEKLYQVFKERRYAIFSEIEEKWYRNNNVELGNLQFLVQDPDGYVLRFFQDLGSREYKTK